jgi:hypothetical protein
MAKDQRVYRVVNLLFLEGKQGFISKETGNRDLRGDIAFQRVFNKVPSGRSGAREAQGAKDTSSTATTGAGGDGGAITSGENGAEVESSQNSGLTDQ